MPALNNRDEILDAALKLEESDRLAVVDRLLETLPEDLLALDPDDPTFHEELLRRSGDPQDSIPWETLRDEAP